MLHGKQIIGNATSAEGSETFQGVDPSTGRALDSAFHEATEGEVDRAMRLADAAFAAYRRKTASERARFLVAIAEQIDAIGDVLLERTAQETGLPIDPRLRGERARTGNQLRMFAALIEEGSWVDARIDSALPERKPIPRPDLRRMLIPMGPVVAFAASNFPLAISVAGNDTASSLAAGCPVVVKAHPAHPGASELVAGAIVKAAQATGMPEGVFSMLHGRGHGVGVALVRHPLTKAVGFTGSLRAGRALHDAAASRAEPIPLYAEMGSINPVFILPGALAERGRQIAEGLKASVTLGVGQFCTNPGLVIGLQSEQMGDFVNNAAALLGATPQGTMLYPGIGHAYQEQVARFEAAKHVQVVARSASSPATEGAKVPAVMFQTDADTFLHNSLLHEEVFGPATMVVTGQSKAELLEIAAQLPGQLTATIHGTAQDLEEHRDLIDLLQQKVGRLLFNGFPTGIEPCSAIHHGGPYPATSDGRTTSIGTAAIERWVRPLCYQDSPDAMLPEELKDANPCGIWRLIDGQRTRAASMRVPLFAIVGAVLAAVLLWGHGSACACQVPVFGYTLERCPVLAMGTVNDHRAGPATRPTTSPAIEPREVASGPPSPIASNGSPGYVIVHQHTFAVAPNPRGTLLSGIAVAAAAVVLLALMAMRSRRRGGGR